MSDTYSYVQPEGYPYVQGGGPTATLGADQSSDLMAQYANAIARIESSGRYDLQGPTTRTGDRAYGKYQVMGANVGPWTKEALGQELTPSEFLANPQAQDAVFRHKFGQYVSKYGNPQDAASAWFTGGPQSSGAGKSDVLGTTGSKYVSMFNNALGEGGASISPDVATNILGSTPNARLQAGLGALLGVGQERYRLWPERLVRDAMDAPQQAQALAASGLQGRDLDAALVPGAQAMASFAGGGSIPAAMTESGTLGAMGGRLTVPNVGGQGVAPFYSSAMQALDRASFQRASGQQWLGYLRNQPGVKAEELDWMGTPEWLQAQGDAPVSKADLASHMQEQSPQLQEVVRQTPQTSQLPQVVSDWLDSHPNQAAARDVRDAVAEGATHVPLEDAQSMGAPANVLTALSQHLVTSNQPKFASYAMPGASPGSYKELLLTLPNTRNQLVTPQEIARYRELGNKIGRGGLNDEEAAEASKLDYKINGPKEDINPYRSSHWDEPNVLAHVRMNDREVVPSNGGKPLRTLFLEEIQSDWHQQGRREGYQKGSSADLEASQKFFDYAKANFLNRVISHGATEREANNVLSQLEHASEQRQFYSREHNDVEPLLGQTERLYGLEARQLADTYIGAFERKAAAQDEMNKGVPPAPFKSSWPELALKRMIREASEQGYDAIGWTPGEVQAARYDLSKQLNSVRAVRNGDGTYELAGELKDGQAHSFGQRIPEEKLPEYVGKDLAQKIVESKPEGGWKIESAGGGRWKVFNSKGDVAQYSTDKARADFLAEKLNRATTFSGLDLRVGGEGMLKFYDDMLPNVANKLGKKYGARVEMGSTVTHENTYAQSLDNLLPEAPKRYNTKPVHILRITPELRQRALSQGFPLFSAGVPLSVVGHGGRVHTLHPVSHDPFSNEGIQRGESL